MSPGAEQVAELIRQTAAGVPEGIAGLYRLYSGHLLRLGWRLTGSRHDAEDIVHDLFLGLPEAIRSFEHRGSCLARLRHCFSEQLNTLTEYFLSSPSRLNGEPNGSPLLGLVAAVRAQLGKRRPRHEF